MKIRFWGVRGSIPSPGRETINYGGNTPCIEIIIPGERVILEAGSGIRELGRKIAKGAPSPIHIILSHIHWDHIQGLPFFEPIFRKGMDIRIYAPQQRGGSISKLILLQLRPPYCPLGGDLILSKLDFVGLRGGESFWIGDLFVRTVCVSHTGVALAYRLSRGNKSVVYTGDNELDRTIGKEFLEFISSAGLLIADSQYTEREYRRHINWGHSSMERVLRLALAGGVKKVALFHHDPARSDRELRKLEERASRLAKGLSRDLEVFAAQEGREIRL